MPAPPSPGDAPEHPSSVGLSAVRALWKQLPAADRVKIADALTQTEGG